MHDVVLDKVVAHGDPDKGIVQIKRKAAPKSDPAKLRKVKRGIIFQRN